MIRRVNQEISRISFGVWAYWFSFDISGTTYNFCLPTSHLYCITAFSVCSECLSQPIVDKYCRTIISFFIPHRVLRYKKLSYVTVPLKEKMTTYTVFTVKQRNIKAKIQKRRTEDKVKKLVILEISICICICNQVLYNGSSWWVSLLNPTLAFIGWWRPDSLWMQIT